MNTGKNSMIVILGPTATGKTRLACLAASRIGAEVISADSRQVYRGMDIGTGKDYKDYLVGAQQIPYHLIDIAEPGTEYNVYQYQKDFIKAFRSINERNKRVMLCGGTGMYLEAVLKGYQLLKVPVNQKLRVSLEPESDHQLSALLQSSKKPHNITDTSDRKRLIRAIEIQHYYRNHPELMEDFPKIDCQIFGVHFPREIIRERITTRLKIRLGSGMIDEV
ncbi:MAG: isopentenyl transferase family protein, partial [Bacteroidota bacterium]|nr:isopentenyl transferase family protein [Bacteroidota bacterium]